ncbi:MAG: protein kinase [Sandaracinaceae bacterium]|nr:protein kinase [Sandaracinaceae bacterium]
MQRIGRHAVGRELTAKGLLSSFEADHEGAPVLLRVFMAGIQADAADVRRFEEQAQITAGLDHPGVARLVGWSASDPVHVSTPPLRGATLAEVCAAAPPKRLDPLVVAALAAELAAAFGAAHASGLVHAGLSPDTIVIGTDGHAKIIDFALARFITSLSASSSQVMRGAIECLAPEHIESPDDIGPPTDVFGLGVVMYRAMTGQEPFEAASALATSILLSIGKPTPIEARGVSIPEPLGQLVMSMLAREPSERPTMRDIAGSLSSMAALPSGPYLDTMRELVASSASWLPRAAAAPAPAAAPAAAPRPAPVAPAPSPRPSCRLPSRRRPPPLPSRPPPSRPLPSPRAPRRRSSARCPRPRRTTPRRSTTTTPGPPSSPMARSSTRRTSPTSSAT